ncbi:MAG: porin [Gemmobacter sp.]
MKKVLFATTALALSAGVAAAEVKFGGDARMGLQYNSAGWTGANTPTVRLEKRFTLNIDGSTTTDGGVTLAARARIRSDENAGAAVSGARVSASFAGLTVTAGNIDSPIEQMGVMYRPLYGLGTGLGWTQLVGNVTGRGHAQFAWDSFSSTGNGAEGISLQYSMAGFTLRASHSSEGLRAGTGGNVQRTAVGAAYTFQGWTFEAAYQDATASAAAYAPGTNLNTIEDKLILGVSGAIGQFGVGLAYGIHGADANRINKIVGDVSYRIDSLTLSAFVANQDFSTGITNPTTFGVGATYGLGGGATLGAAVQSTPTGTTRGDLGVSFRF